MKTGPSAERVAGAPTTPSEVALTLAALVPALPREAVRDLAELLAYQLTFTTPAEAREIRLGLLLDLVAVSDGELPASEDYQRERAARNACGEKWQDASTLSHAYNGWDRACRAAMRLHYLGGNARVPADFSHGRQSATYPRAEVLDAIDRFRARHGDWPRYIEFFRWGTALRKHARHNGGADPRVPNARQLRSACGEFWRAVRAAEERAEARAGGGGS